MAAVRSTRSRTPALLLLVACALVATALHGLSFVFGSGADGPKAVAVGLGQRRFGARSIISRAAEDNFDDFEYVPLPTAENLKAGAKFEGIVTQVRDFGAFVDIGWDYVGLVPKSMLSDNFVEEVGDVVKEGDGATVWVVDHDKEKKRMTLTMTKKKMNRLPQGKQEPPCDLNLFSEVPDDMWLDGEVVGTAGFGAFVKVSPPGHEGSAQGLVPLGEVKDGFVDDITEEVEIGQKVKVRVRSVDPEKNRLSLSMKQKEMPPADIASFVDLPADTWLDGTVDNTAAFGAFVKVSPPGSELSITGLVPLREIKDGLVTDINQEVTAGQQVKVRILDADVGSNRLSLSMKQEVKKADMSGFANVPDTEWLKGSVVSLQNYGAFVEVPMPDGMGKAQGLLHISQILDDPEDPGEVLEEDMEVQVRVINVDTEAGKLSLSMKPK